MLNGVVALLALAGLCAFLAAFLRLSAGLCPLAALALIVPVLELGGLLGLLRGAAVLTVGLGLAGGAAAVVKLRRIRIAPPVRSASPGAVVFWCGAAVLLLYLFWLQPEFTIYDEYSFWGTAARLTGVSHRLYTVCQTDLPWQMTQMPVIPLTSYFVQWFGDFSAWKTIWAVDLLLLAALAAVAEQAAGASPRLALPVAAAAVLVPFLFSGAGAAGTINTVYLECLGDGVAGVLFGGAAAFWWRLRKTRPGLWWLMLPVACLCAHVKDNTFVLGLAAAGIAALDLLLFGWREEEKLSPTRFAAALALLACPLAQYLGWNAYTAHLVRANAEAGGLGATSQPLTAVLIQGTRLFLGLPTDLYYQYREAGAVAYAQSLARLFFTEPVWLGGSGFALALLIAGLFAAALLLAGSRRLRLQTAVCAVGSGLCFLGYWYMLLLSYAFILKDSDPAAPASYARYFQSFYAGWLLLALAVLAAAAASSRLKFAANGAALAIGVACAALVFANTDPHYAVLGLGRGSYAALRQQQGLARQVVEATDAEDRIFLVRQGDTGFYWFSYMEALYPRTLIHGDGGVSYGLPEFFDNYYYLSYTPEEFLQKLQGHGATVVFIARCDERFTASYAALFDDGLSAAQNGPALYRVTENGFVFWQALEGGAAL